MNDLEARYWRHLTEIGGQIVKYGKSRALRKIEFRNVAELLGYEFDFRANGNIAGGRFKGANMTAAIASMVRILYAPGVLYYKIDAEQWGCFGMDFKTFQKCRVEIEERVRRLQVAERVASNQARLPFVDN